MQSPAFRLRSMTVWAVTRLIKSLIPMIVCGRAVHRGRRWGISRNWRSAFRVRSLEYWCIIGAIWVVAESTWNGPGLVAPFSNRLPQSILKYTALTLTNAGSIIAGPAPRLGIVRVNRLRDLAVRVLGNPLVDFVAGLRLLGKLGGMQRRGKALAQQVT